MGWFRRWKPAVHKIGQQDCKCKMPDPEAFMREAAHSKLSLETWYKALWYVQHDYESPARMAEYLHVTYGTALSIKRRIDKMVKR